MKTKFYLLLSICTTGYAFSQVGINTITPQKTLDIEGTLRLSETETANRPSSLTTSSIPLYVNSTNGTVQYAPNGYTKITGGFRPGGGLSYTVARLPVTNTIARIRFMSYVDNSNDTNNSDTAAYAYGEFTVIGTGTADPIKFVETSMKGFNGSPKAYTINPAKTVITWNNNSQQNTSLTINQTTGTIIINNGTTTFSYFFEVLGGI